jgi:hypothetical protein
MTYILLTPPHGAHPKGGNYFFSTGEGFLRQVQDQRRLLTNAQSTHTRKQKSVDLKKKKSFGVISLVDPDCP